MAKKIKTDDDELKTLIAKENNPEHFEPMKEISDEERESIKPKAVDPKHLKPQE